MKAWRRRIKEWPVVLPQTMDPASAPAWMQGYESEEATSPDEKETPYKTVCLGLLFLFPLILVTVLQAKKGNTVMTLILGLSSVAGLFGVLCFLLPLQIEKIAARQRRRLLDRLAAQGKPVLGGDAVNVSYAGGFWKTELLGGGMDHGVLRIDFDRLTFTGLSTDFELSPSSILQIKTFCLSDVDRYTTFRLFVTWLYEGTPQTLSIGLPYRRSLRQRVEEIDELRSRLEAWRSECRPLASKRSSKNPPILEPLRTAPSGYQRLGHPAKILGALAVILLCGASGGLTLAFSIWLSGKPHFVPFLFMMPAGFLLPIAAGIEKRLPERYRFRDTNPTPLAENLGEMRNEAVEAPISQVRSESALGESKT